MEVHQINNNLYYLVFIGSFGGLLLASSVIFFYIRYQRKFLLQQAASQKAELEHKQQLLFAVIRSQEEERIRISKDLHDHVGGSLSHLRFMVARIKNAGSDMQLINNLSDEYRTDIDRVIEDVRNISHSLSPAGLELWGFREALEEHCEKLSASAALAIDITDSTGDTLNGMRFDDALSLFRIIQELLSNTVKHAQAQKVNITIANDAGDVSINYTDDGKGMDIDPNKKRGIGLYNIESRAGMLNAVCTVTSAPGAGYQCNIRLSAEKIKQNNAL